ncbi:acyl-CoA thioesterase [Pseudonocardia pini]|uniref:acyl-CoA thioesterase n=1 Tax=Pseudonocardia pini TaxID=2758030 RepID=UPI0028AEC987|nr:acyl-CoA thioesterase domain-containing protein [Pseudonocardia pini]
MKRSPTAPVHVPLSVDLLELLSLEPLGRDVFHAPTVFDDDFALYGGQVAAQALLAAGATVPDGRAPHSMHGYFLRGGDPAVPTEFRVDRDRDGGSFSARRVVATQRGEVVFSMGCSFQVGREGPEHQVASMPVTQRPEELRAYAIPRLASMEGRAPVQPRPAPWPTRIWARCARDLPDRPLVHAAVLTYLSDISAGTAPLTDEHGRPGPSLDHSIWFHRPVQMDEWVLMDLTPVVTAGGRGWYSGTIHTAEGVLVADLAQESLFRRPAPKTT